VYRLVLVSLAFIGLAATIAIGAEHRGRASAALGGSAPDIVLFSKGDPFATSVAPAALAKAHKAATSAEFEQATGPHSVLVIDRSAWAEVDPAFLRGRLQAGLPIYAINVSLAELSAATGYAKSLEARDPATAAALRFPPAPDGASYSFVWISQPDESNGSWHNAMGQDDLSSRLLAANLHNSGLLAQRLALLPETGEVVPLSQLTQ
jgi:hypothetical protein